MTILRPRPLQPLTVFTVIYMIISGIHAGMTENSEFIFYLIVMIIMGVLTLLIHRRVQFPLILLWALSLWGLLHMMGGMYVLQRTDDVLYNYWIIPGFLRYDQLTHAYGFGIATWACWICLKAIHPDLKPTTGPLSLVLFAGLGLGAFNEIVEFFATLLFPKTNVGDYTNVGWDLVSNLIGGLIALALIRSCAGIVVPCGQSAVQAETPSD
jgi:uncharacterized membrane protein YjdF